MLSVYLGKCEFTLRNFLNKIHILFLEERTMKKTLWATVLLLVCAILLSSCGSKNEKQPSDDTTNNTQETHTHSFEEWITIKKPSCTEDGTNERYCACGEKQVQTISAFGHTEIVDNAINSTCQTNGKSEGKHCSVCGVVIIEQTSLPLANHTYDNENDEKCNICGYERYISCKHTNTEVLKAVEATCTASGLTEGSKCVDCGETLVAQVATSPKGHISTTVKGYDSTCKQTGLTDSVKCSICNTELETAIIIPVKPHEYTDKYDESCNQCGFIRDAECAHINTSVIPGKNATCTEAGLTDGSKCNKCGETLVAQTTIGKLGHVEVIDAAIAATCTADGKAEGKHCSRCNEILVAQTTIGKLGHVEVIDAAIAATCTADGKAEGKHCSRCNEILVAQTTISKLGHVEVVNAAISATCTNEGKTEGKSCSRCGEITVPQSTSKMLPHEFDNDLCSVCHGEGKMLYSCWDGSIAESFHAGDGTRENPYRIQSGNELALLSQLCYNGNSEYSNKYYVLEINIDLQYLSWTPIGREYKESSSKPVETQYSFCGYFDGNGHVIKGLSNALFGYINSASIQNLGVVDANIQKDGLAFLLNTLWIQTFTIALLKESSMLIQLHLDMLHQQQDFSNPPRDLQQ